MTEENVENQSKKRGRPAKKDAKKVAKKTSKKATKKTTKKTPKKVTPKKACQKIGPRNSDGLFDSIEYKYDDFGFVDWKSLIPKEYLFPNKQWFHLRKKDVPKSVDELSDEQLLIKLAGIKWLARLRGYESINFSIERSNEESCVVKCSIEWLPNFEFNSRVNTSEIASATYNNCDGFGKAFLESIAANRAFTRCVRNFLNIHIVGDEEIGPYKNDDEPESLEENASKASSNGPALSFITIAKKKLDNLESVIWFCKKNEIDMPADIETEEDLAKCLNADQCKKLMTLLKKRDN